jgi:hypothetical protein
VKMMSGMRITEISFDFNHEQEYISADLENGKMSNGMLIFTSSTSDMTCYAPEICFTDKVVTSIVKKCEKWVVEQGLINKWLKNKRGI